MTADDQDLPVFVTFETGARLLVKLGIDTDATAATIRYTARSDEENWPFGPGKLHKYVMVGNARTMETGVFLDYFQRHPRSGRGPDKAPRKRRGEPE